MVRSELFRAGWLTVLVVLSLVVGASAAVAFSPEMETNVIVVGGGLAGLSAAVAALDGGADVILVEKMPFLGGSSLLSGGGILAAESHIQKEYGMTQTKEELEEYWYEQQAFTAAPDGYPDPDFVGLAINEAPQTIRFLDNSGVVFGQPWSFYPEVEDRLHAPAEGGASGLIVPLTEYVESHGGTILTNTSAVELIQDSTGAIVGIRAETADGLLEIGGRAVVLACGGFSQNLAMMASVSPVAGDHISVAGLGNVGDGYAMAEAVGAAFHEEDWIIGLRSQAVQGSSPLNNLGWTTGLYTTPKGERFTNEHDPYSVLYNTVTSMELDEYFLIFDETMSQVLEPGIELGVVFRGDSPEELAEDSGMDPVLFAETAARYNALAAAGVDEDFGKPAELMTPLAEGTLYALRVTPTQMGTMGGVRTTLSMQVLNDDGAVIPGLYAAGEMANRPYYGRVYVSGSALLIAATTGRIAGEHAAQ